MKGLCEGAAEQDAAEADRQAHICAECDQVGVPDAAWKCPHCTATMRFGYRYHPCPHCRREAFWTRVRNRYDNHCLCRETPDQRRARLEDEAIRDRRELKEFEAENRRRELGMARVLTQALMDDAKHCWENEKRRKCTVSRSEINETGGPRESCRVCPKFIKEVDQKR